MSVVIQRTARSLVLSMLSPGLVGHRRKAAQMGHNAEAPTDGGDLPPRQILRVLNSPSELRGHRGDQNYYRLRI